MTVVESRLAKRVCGEPCVLRMTHVATVFYLDDEASDAMYFIWEIALSTSPASSVLYPLKGAGSLEENIALRCLGRWK